MQDEESTVTKIMNKVPATQLPSAWQAFITGAVIWLLVHHVEGTTESTMKEIGELAVAIGALASMFSRGRRQS